jgi:magnesium-transporting ATPase (P-type)
VFAGTTVAGGNGKAIVFATAMNTEFGKIAHLTQSLGEELSPLQKEIAVMTKMVSVVAVGAGILFFVVALLMGAMTLAEGFIFALGMIVAFVPEGLLPTVTLALAMGVQRIARRNALVKRLSAVETLGSTTVICTDKTGTLTENEMTVRALWVARRQIQVSGAGYAPDGSLEEKGRRLNATSDPLVARLLIAASLCNNTRLLPPSEAEPRWTILGDPTEAALLVAAAKAGLNLQTISKEQPRLREAPFDSRRKRMSTLHQATDRQWVYVKGAPKELLALCQWIALENGKLPLTEELRAKIMAANDEYASNGLRVLAVACRPWYDPVSCFKADSAECDLLFLGLMAMMDPPRPEVSDAVQRCHEAGIRIIMITGDYGLTAATIARRIGIVRCHLRAL